MSEKIEPISALYTRYAQIYAAIASDRDFRHEAECILHRAFGHCSSDGRRGIELFCGPAEHSLVLQRMGLDIFAVDSSPLMATIAQTSGIARDRIIIGALPEIACRLPDALSLGIALRYSLGYLDCEQVLGLLGGLRSRFVVGGSLFLELHRIDLIAGGLDRLSIRSRRVTLPDGSEADCRWPDGPLRWDRESWTADLLVTVEQAHSNSFTKLKFLSREHIHTVSDIRKAAKAVGGWSVELCDDRLENSFPESEIVRLEAI